MLPSAGEFALGGFRYDFILRKSISFMVIPEAQKLIQ